MDKGTTLQELSSLDTRLNDPTNEGYARGYAAFLEDESPAYFIDAEGLKQRIGSGRHRIIHSSPFAKGYIAGFVQAHDDNFQ